MTEVRLNDEVLGQVLVCFDGRVLEVFSEGPASISRFHIGLLVIEAKEPDRKGRHQVDFAPVRAGRNGVRLILSEADRRAIEPVLVEVRSALTQSSRNF